METMESNEWSAAGPVVDTLIAEPQGYNLFQAINLLEAAARKSAPEKQSDTMDLSVRLRSVVSLAFQSSDVSKVSLGAIGAESYTLHTAVMSLAGAGGPLPLPYTELVLERTASRDHATAEFLDIFNHRFLAFLYRSRKKHNMGLNGQTPQSSPLAACLDSLSALGLKAGVRAPSGEAGWLEHAGLMGGAPRSMTGLLTLLSDRFGVRATGQQFCGGWRSLEQRDVLALKTRGAQRSPRLGQTAVLGRRVWDQSAGIRIALEDLSLKRLTGLLKGGSEHTLMHWLVRRYLPQDMDVEIILQLKPQELKPTTLGLEQGLRLGLTSWLVTGGNGKVSPAKSCFKLENEAAWT
jgi:type VI secretion system protein ImpH